MWDQQVLPQKKAWPGEKVNLSRPLRRYELRRGQASFPPLSVFGGIKNLNAEIVSQSGLIPYLKKIFPEKELDILESKEPSFLMLESVMASRISSHGSSNLSFPHAPALS